MLLPQWSVIIGTVVTKESTSGENIYHIGK